MYMSVLVNDNFQTEIIIFKTECYKIILMTQYIQIILVESMNPFKIQVHVCLLMLFLQSS